MYKNICVTNRHLVEGDFLKQLAKVAEGGCDAIILREKDLSEAEYEKLAEQALKVCEIHGTKCILHTYIEAAIRQKAEAIHLSFPVWEKINEIQKQKFSQIGVSIHSVEEAVAAAEQGADYLTAGHIFATDCKKGVPPRGLGFLREVCQTVSIPVYAIGGIQEENVKDCIEAGAAGVCRMSFYMKKCTVWWNSWQN